MVAGTCRLCRKSNAELRDSHVVPKWAYKLMRDESAECGNPNPLFVTPAKTVQTSKQVKDYLLCEACEQMFSERERIVRSLAPGTGHSTLRDHILAQNRMLRQKSGECFYVGSIDKFDTSALSYFSLSVMWRAAVARGSDCERIRLGPYLEAFRAYLNDPTVFPKHVIVVLSLLAPETPGNTSFDKVVVFPCSHRDGTCHVHRTLICGLYFEVRIGKCQARDVQTLCIATAPKKMACVVESRHLGILRDAVKLIERSPAPSFSARRPSQTS